MVDIVEHYVYRLDASDAITFVNDDWRRFARENEAPELDHNNILGKSLWTFIAGEEIQALYRRVFHHLRVHRSEFMVPFRCDSPTTIRNMHLTLRPLAFGGIECEGKMISSEKRAPLAIYSRCADHSEEQIAVCGLCRRLWMDDTWVDVSSAVVRSRLFCVEPVPRLNESVCPACEQTVQTELKICDKLIGMQGKP